MKNHYLIFISLLLCCAALFSACGASEYATVSAGELFPDAEPYKNDPAGEIEQPEETEPPVVQAVLPELVFFLDDLSDTFAPITAYAGYWTWGREIGCFGIIPKLSGSVPARKSYAAYWEAGGAEFPDLAEHRVGYRLDFTTWGGRSYSLTILDPKDTSGDWNEFLEVYLYDDIHQTEGVFYSHLLYSDMNEETVITSIKLVGAIESPSVRSISLYAFLYGGEQDFDENGEYCGTGIYGLPISELG